MNCRFIFGCAAAALFVPGAGALAQQAPSNAELYKIILQLQADQRRMQDENRSDKEKIERVQSELSETKRELTAERKRRTEKVVAGAPLETRKAEAGVRPAEHAAPPATSPEPFVLPTKVTNSPAPSLPPVAVEKTNLKFEGGGSATDTRKTTYQAAALTTPLGDAFGLQGDILTGERLGAGTYVGGAGHLFTRDPDRGLLGVYGSVAYYDSQLSPFSQQRDFVFGKAGATGELYLNRFTFSALAGLETGGVRDTATVTFGETGKAIRPTDNISLSYYATDDLKLTVGQNYTLGLDTFALKSEALLPVGWGTGVSVFAEGRLGERGYREATGGLKIYFGDEQKTLIGIQRHDDPEIFLADDFATLNQNMAAKPIVAASNAPPTIIIEKITKGTGAGTGGATVTGKRGRGIPVFDQNGKRVGTLLSQNQMIIRENGVPVLVQIDNTGIVSTGSGGVLFLHTSANCSGPRYIDAGSVPANGQVVGTTLYYPGGTPSNIAYGSYEQFNNGQNLSQPGQCFVANGPSFAGVAATATVYTGPLSLRR